MTMSDPVGLIELLHKASRNFKQIQIVSDPMSNARLGEVLSLSYQDL